MKTGSCSLRRMDLVDKCPYVLGARWSGPIFTVGTGKMFTIMGAAVAAMTGPTLILVFPGTYTNDSFTATHDIYIRGVGRLWTDSTFNFTNDSQGFSMEKRFLIEYIKLNRTAYDWRGVIGAFNASDMRILNKCDVMGSNGNAYTINSSGNPTSIFHVRHCYLVRGYAHFHYLNNSQTYIHRCLNNNATYAYQCDGSFAENDYVTSTTVGYGPVHGHHMITNIDAYA